MSDLIQPVLTFLAVLAGGIVITEYNILRFKRMLAKSRNPLIKELMK